MSQVPKEGPAQPRTQMVNKESPVMLARAASGKDDL
jgi:hypothetical protein